MNNNNSRDSSDSDINYLAPTDVTITAAVWWEGAPFLVIFCVYLAYVKQNVLLYRRVLRDRLGHTSGSPFHAQHCLINQTHCFWLVHCVTQWLLLIDWLISGMILLSHLAVVFLSNNCLFLAAFIMFSRNIYTPKKVAGSGQNSQKIQGIQAFDWKKSLRNALRTLLSLAGSWISTVQHVV